MLIPLPHRRQQAQQALPAGFRCGQGHPSRCKHHPTYNATMRRVREPIILTACVKTGQLAQGPQGAHQHHLPPAEDPQALALSRLPP